MLINVIIAHPNPESLNHSIMDAFLEGCKEAGHQTNVFDLYKMNFNPVISMEEVKEHKLPGDIMKIQEELLKGEVLVFIFPNWWSSMPAILKGFIDRVFTEGFALKRTSSFPKGILPFKKALIINTQAAPGFINFIFTNYNKKVVKSRILKFSGVKKTSFVCFGGAADKVQKAKIEKFLHRIKNLAKKF